MALSFAVVKEIISCDSFFVLEIEVSKTAREWIRSNPILENLLNCIRPSGIVSANDVLDMIKTRSEKVDSQLKNREYLILDINVAASNRNAQVIDGELRMALLNGDCKSYDMEMERGFKLHLRKDVDNPCIIRILVRNCDNRKYSYYIETSIDCENWKLLMDKRNEERSSWQHHKFEPKLMIYVKIVGTRNTEIEYN
ncbi:unnamed protein product [Soboliphyme baturini]|uniref:F5/8 type C domain-containing protein n=1 Tax=Soboliphyme baturini TaxID=241478 RepID=A0A183J139_9BILA|nr:unnamed protein product [Soboliphyme baturini]